MKHPITRVGRGRRHVSDSFEPVESSSASEDESSLASGDEAAEMDDIVGPMEEDAEGTQ